MPLPHADKISAILYYHGEDSSTDIYGDLKTASFPVVSVVRDILSRENENNTAVSNTEEFKQVHLSTEEWLLSVLLKHQGDAQSIIRRKRPVKPWKRRKKNYKLQASSSLTETL